MLTADYRQGKVGVHRVVIAAGSRDRLKLTRAPRIYRGEWWHTVTRGYITEKRYLLRTTCTVAELALYLASHGVRRSCTSTPNWPLWSFPSVTYSWVSLGQRTFNHYDWYWANECYKSTNTYSPLTIVIERCVSSWLLTTRGYYFLSKYVAHDAY